MAKRPLSEERKQQLRENLAQARAAKSAKAETFQDLSVEKKIIYHYQHAQGSIQDLARIYNVPVSRVLDLVGEGNLSTVQMGGDLIDAQEAGPNVEMNYGKDFEVPYTVD